MRRILSLVLATAAVATWFVLFRPAALGGPAGYVVVSGTSMQPTLRTGDLVVTRTRPQYRQGDVIAYHVPAGLPGAGKLVIHRIIGGDASAGFTTQGDNRHEPDDWHPKAHDVLGTMWVQGPGVGTWVAKVRQPPVFAALAAGFTVFSILLGPSARRRRRDDEAAGDPTGLGDDEDTTTHLDELMEAGL